MRYLGWLAILAVGCAAPGTDSMDPNDPSDPTTDGGVALPRFRNCTGRAFTPAPIQPWRHDYLTPIVTAAGAANHWGRDLMVPTTPGTVIRGKFTYGLVSVDLEDEDVRVSIDDCTSWVALGDHTTDANGEIAVPLSAGLEPGVYEVRFQVLGDRSTTSSTVWVLPRGTHVIVTDIDGTLTVGDSELFKEMLDGSYVPVAYPGANDLTTAHRGRGDVVMYLTGRPDWLMKTSRAWLANRGFAAGPLRVTDTLAQVLPTQAGVGEFKRSVVASLLAAGYLVDTAYGNASTDIYAYLGANIPADDVWIIGEHAGEQGTHAAASWGARVDEVEVMPATAQPFAP